MYRVKQQVKERVQFIQDERRKQACEDVYEAFIKDLTYRIKIGTLDGVLQPYKIYVDVDLLGVYGMGLVYDFSLRNYLEEKGVPVLEIGWDRARYDWETADGTITEWMTEIHRFYIEIDMIKIWALERE